MSTQLQEPAIGSAFEDGAAYRQLVESIKLGQCILFLGAGVHYPPPEHSRFSYPEGHRPPLGGALAERLADKCDFAQICSGEPKWDLQRVSLCYEHELGRQALVDEIKASVDDNTRPSAAVRALAELPFTMVMTTNYDTLFERALRRDGIEKRPVVGVYTPRRYERTPDYRGNPTSQAPFVFKTHGDIGVPDSIVVTDEDYITFVLRMNEPREVHPIPETFLYQLNRVPTLFVGYGLLDFNLRLLFRTMRARLDAADRPPSYSVDVRPDPLVSGLWTREHGLQFIVEDVWKFVPRLYQDVLGTEMRP